MVWRRRKFIVGVWESRGRVRDIWERQSGHDPEPGEELWMGRKRDERGNKNISQEVKVHKGQVTTCLDYIGKTL